MSQLHFDAQDLKTLFPNARVIRHCGGSKDPWGVVFETPKGKRVLAKHNQVQDLEKDEVYFTSDVLELGLPVVTKYRGVFYMFEHPMKSTKIRQGHILSYTMSQNLSAVEKALIREFGAVKM